MTEHISEHWEPYFDEEEAKAVIGKHLLVGVTCRVPDEYLLKSKRPLLFGREVLTAVVAQWIHPDTTC